MRPKHGRVALVAAVLLAVAAGATGVTAAGFWQRVDATAYLSGTIAIGQGPKDTDAYPSVDKANVVAKRADNARPIMRLHTKPTSDPTRETTEFQVKVQTRAVSAPVEARLTMSPAGEINEAHKWLRVGVYIGDESQLDKGVPISPAALNALNKGEGLKLGTLAANGANPLTFTVRVWLDPAAPREAYEQKVDLALAINGETVPTEATVEAVYP